jgi:probable F420-dependent oxidoreductase
MTTVKAPGLKVGIRLRWIRHDIDLVTAVTEEADRLGFESVWLPDRVIYPTDMMEKMDAVHRSLGQQLTINEPAYDNFVYLAYLAARTTRIRFGTAIWQIGLRHPFVAARAVQTLDIVSHGRVEVGVGAGWLSSEYDAMALNFRSRGRRLDEEIEICQKLWSEDIVEHHGEFFDFGPVKFEPKPIQKPWPPLHAGGEGTQSLRRAARLGGWIGRNYPPEEVRRYAERLRRFRAEAGLDDQMQISVRPPLEEIDRLATWSEVGATRLYTCPWARGEDPFQGMRRFADRHGLIPSVDDKSVKS